ncbi:MAG TPA: glucans biosynthesis glucosyltransferase MdoH [Acetobacteraceae bacterium]|jgi:membrane glycosyltransferase|nr:glucans biosynthesis glucosyltransferase MdoH [Acetobacteraceae bacterium]
MILRRVALVTIAFAATLAVGALLVAVLAVGGWTWWKLGILGCFVVMTPWLGLGPGNGLIGFLVLIGARHPARAVLPVSGDIETGPVTAPTAIAVTIRNEAMELVLPPVRALLDGLDASGQGGCFTLFVLSDTQDPALAATEAEAVARFAAAGSTPGRIRYRRRTGNDGFKAGNVMDFLDRLAGGFELAIMLDADSQMSADAVLRLVRIMQRAPRLAIVQHLTVGLPALAPLPRFFQFGMRAGMRTWATGQAWWQGAEGPYWGHNAIIRIAPFRQYCRLPALPDGSRILSHDQVEAARLCGAGWGVCVWAEETGSYEANPPTLPEFLRRDERWMAGNLQYRHLLAMPGLRPLGRWQLLQAILLFSGGPCYTAMLALAAVGIATTGAVHVPAGRLLALALAWPAAVYAPKWLGDAEVLLSRRRRASYGGAGRFLAGVAAETVFTLLLDAIALPHKTLGMTRLALGVRAGWAPQNRRARGVGWREAARMFWPHTLFGIAALVLLATGSRAAALWLLPFVAGLPLAIPFCVLTSSGTVSAWLRRRGIAAIPEEIAPARHLQAERAGAAAPATPAAMA